MLTRRDILFSRQLQSCFQEGRSFFQKGKPCYQGGKHSSRKQGWAWCFLFVTVQLIDLSLML